MCRKLCICPRNFWFPRYYFFHIFEHFPSIIVHVYVRFLYFEIPLQNRNLILLQKMFHLNVSTILENVAYVYNSEYKWLGPFLRDNRYHTPLLFHVFSFFLLIYNSVNVVTNGIHQSFALVNVTKKVGGPNWRTIANILFLIWCW